ncbi:SDR family oxidoreductase [Micromonospora sp. ATA32]|nr:SDR family oxidoreductase [Micromonospora sp. ATA32]
MENRFRQLPPRIEPRYETQDVSGPPPLPEVPETIGLTVAGQVADLDRLAGALARAPRPDPARPVALVDRDGEAVARAAKELAGSIAIQADISDADQVKAAFETTVSQLGRLDVVFNNAAIDGRMARLHELEIEDWRKVAAVNGDGSFMVFKNAIDHFLQAGGGVIVSTASTTALVGKPDGVSAYSYSKGGLISLTRTAAIEYAADNIRVNAVAPTVVLTPMLEQFIADSEDPAATQSMVDHFNPMPGVVVPEEIATVVAFLASDDARRITGVTLPVDAGDTAR